MFLLAFGKWVEQLLASTVLIGELELNEALKQVFVLQPSIICVGIATL